MKGIIQSYLENRGYGFILVGYKTRYFFHVTKFDSPTPPRKGQIVEFELAPSRKPGYGPEAVQVRPIESLPESKSEVWS